MTNQRMASYLTLLISLLVHSAQVSAASLTDPCDPDHFLNIVDRPTVADSACVVPLKKAVLELGYQYQELTHSAGHQQNFPEAVFRVGLPFRNEFVVVLPNQIRQASANGSTATTMGIKHEVGYNAHWLGSLEALFTLPNGSAAYGSERGGAAFNGIVSYTFNEEFNFSFMLGVVNITAASSEGGQRYTTVNPDGVLTYSINPKLNLYGEIYGQSKTAPHEGSGFNADTGLLYLLLPACAVDIEVGQRISGRLAGFNHYVGVGASFMM